MVSKRNWRIRKLRGSCEEALGYSAHVREMGRKWYFVCQYPIPFPPGVTCCSHLSRKIDVTHRIHHQSPLASSTLSRRVWQVESCVCCLRWFTGYITWVFFFPFAFSGLQRCYRRTVMTDYIIVQASICYLGKWVLCQCH